MLIVDMKETYQFGDQPYMKVAPRDILSLGTTKSEVLSDKMTNSSFAEPFVYMHLFIGWKTKYLPHMVKWKGFSLLWTILQ